MAFQGGLSDFENTKVLQEEIDHVQPDVEDPGKEDSAIDDSDKDPDFQQYQTPSSSENSDKVNSKIKICTFSM